jgi:hypothetical protein
MEECSLRHSDNGISDSSVRVLDSQLWSAWPLPAPTASFSLLAANGIVIGLENYLLAFGGFSGFQDSQQQGATSNVAVLDVSSRQWVQVLPSQLRGLPAELARGFASAAGVVDSCGHLFVLGGDNGAEQTFADVFFLSLAQVIEAAQSGSSTVEITALQPFELHGVVPVPRAYHTQVVTDDDRLIVVGGSTNYDNTLTFPDFSMLDLRSGVWHNLTALFPNPALFSRRSCLSRRQQRCSAVRSPVAPPLAMCS